MEESELFFLLKPVVSIQFDCFIMTKDFHFQVALAQQHYTTLTKSLDKSFVSLHHGGSTIDLSDENQWNTELQNYHIFIFINQIFLNLLRHGRFCKLSRNLLNKNKFI